jgi:hypothetical protein
MTSIRTTALAAVVRKVIELPHAWDDIDLIGALPCRVSGAALTSRPDSYFRFGGSFGEVLVEAPASPKVRLDRNETVNLPDGTEITFSAVSLSTVSSTGRAGLDHDLDQPAAGDFPAPRSIR